MTDDRVLLELVRDMHQRIERLERLAPKADDAGVQFCQALIASWGVVPFYSCDLIDWITAQPILREDLLQALQRLFKSDKLPTPVQLGQALRRLSTARVEGFTVESTDRRGTVEWQVLPVRG